MELSQMTNEQLWQLFPIILKEHHASYALWYAEEEKQLTRVIGQENIKRVSLVGSTAVEGLLAKPTVDILLEITNDCDTKRLIEVLTKNGYIYAYKPDNPPPHMLLMKGYTNNGFEEKVFHLHIRYLGDWNELYFRDYLKANKNIADAYGTLKLALQQRYRYNRDEYTMAKTEFIMKYTSIAREQWKNRYLA